MVNDIFARGLAKKATNNIENNKITYDIIYGDYYVDCNIGNDSNNGEYNKPYKTISKAISVAAIGNTIIIQGGKYNEVIDISKSDLKLIGIGNVIIDGIDREINVVNFTSLTAQLTVDQNNIYIKNINVVNSPAIAIRVGGSGCIFENVNALDSYLGFFIYGDNNKFFNCKAMYNYDFGGIPEWEADNVGENADGFSVSSDNNKFYNCIAAYNADDGFDTYGQRGNQFYNCKAFQNGLNIGCRNRDKSAYSSMIFKGNGNGFKVGPGTNSTTEGKRRSADNILSYCISFNNMGDEFDSNGGAGNRFINCKAFNSAIDLSDKRAFRLGDITDTLDGDEVNNYYTNCVAYPHNSNYLAIEGATNIQTNNSWNNSFIITESDLVSIEPNSDYFLNIPKTGRLVDLNIID